MPPLTCYNRRLRRRRGSDAHVKDLRMSQLDLTTRNEGNGNGVKLNFATDWKYAPAPETAKVSLKPRYDLFIDGQFVAAAKGAYFDTTNPATEKKLAEVALAGAEDVDRAVKAARRAYDN